ncbi:hypothetical protein AVEN_72050-1, partial [Araneus ventricosus]
CKDDDHLCSLPVLVSTRSCDILIKVSLTQASWSRESILFPMGYGPFPSYLSRFRLHHSDIWACLKMGDRLHHETSSSDPDKDFSPPPTSQTDGPSRSPIPRTLISPPANF